ncbi:amino acid transporter AVT1C-like [Phoenix dactylifera]|uniref:Amino acid transporter AVT1C-like n=1 Tax=Phoenix dactylifera TaxID=42345 RepID=A0A8B7BJ14_PHODC|nr:amino acid transporter AVT1C-like [Phoenix dactylifera]
MKPDEEMGPDYRGFEVETDDEDNEAQQHDDCPHSSSSSSSSPSAHSSYYSRHHAGEPCSYQPSWPQSYRQSLDILASVPSPNVGFMAGSSLVRAGSSFFRCSTLAPSAPEEVPSLTKPLIYPGSDHPWPPPYAPLPSTPSKGSFGAYSYRDLPPSPQCSTAQAIVNGINVLCGVGILTTPYAVKEGGWLGMLVLFALGAISCYTGVLLKRCLDSSPELQTYPDIGQAAFGMTGRLWISIVLYLELYASCVEYITLVGDSLSSLFPHAHVNFMGVDLSSHQLFAVTTAIMVLPTVWLRNLGLLSYLSAGGVIATILVVICLLWVGAVDRVGFHPGGTALDLANLPVAIGLYGFCYSGHSVFPNIYSSMNIQAQFPAVLIFCFALCTILYAGVAVAGFLMFGESIKSQFTLNMPHQYLSSKIAVWTTVVNPLSKYALTMTPVALSLEELLPSTEQSHLVAVLIRTVLVFSTLFVALLFPFFGFVMALLGSVFTMLVALILPCACYLSIQRRSVNFTQVFVCISIIMVGVVCSCFGSYSSIKQILDRKGH